MPRPAPTSSGPRAEAAALIFGEFARANPVPTPSMPSDAITGVAPAPKVEMESMESSMVTSPANMSGRTPILSDHRPASGEIMASATAPGVSTSPACPGESQLTSETSSGTKTSADTLASMQKYPTTTAATYALFLKSAGETKGSVALLMRQPKPAAATTDPAKLPQDPAEPKPETWPRVIPNKNNPAASPSRMPPGRSKPRAPSGLSSGRTYSAAGIRTAVNTRVPKNR